MFNKQIYYNEMLLFPQIIGLFVLSGCFELTLTSRVCHFSSVTLLLNRMLFNKALVSSITCGICHLIYVSIVRAALMPYHCVVTQLSSHSGENNNSRNKKDGIEVMSFERTMPIYKRGHSPEDAANY